MLYKWIGGSLTQNGKIIIRKGELIPADLLDEAQLARFVKLGKIEVIHEPKPVKKAEPKVVEPVVEMPEPEAPKGKGKSKKSTKVEKPEDDIDISDLV
jgi:hypothetical protein